MQNVTNFKNKGQEGLNRLVDVGKNQPEHVKLWGVTGAAAVAGGLVLTATSQGLLAILATLAAPPVALSVGAVAGGLLGWSFMQEKLGKQTESDDVSHVTVESGEAMASSVAQ